MVGLVVQVELLGSGDISQSPYLNSGWSLGHILNAEYAVGIGCCPQLKI